MIYTHPGREDAQPEVDAREAWVYIMTMAGTRLVKFGFTSRTPGARAKDGTLGPAPLVVARAWRSPDARLIERLVLRRLSNCRVRGEWLALPVDDVAEAVEATAAARGLLLEPDPQAGG